MSLHLVTKYGSNIGNMIWWKGPYVILTTPTAGKVAGIIPWIHHTKVKKTYHADPKNAEWTAHRDPSYPRETKTILKKKEKKILDGPLQDEATQSTPTAWPHQRDFEFNFRSTQDNVFISWARSCADFHHTSNCWICRAMPLSAMDGLPWWVSPLCQGDFKPLCSFLGWQKETFLSLVNHNLSLISWCKTYSQ